MKSRPAPLPGPADPGASVPAKWHWHLQTLLRLRARLQRQSKEHLSEAELPRHTDNDFVALASDTSEFESLISEVNSEAHLLAEVESALQRLRLGTYGICEATQTPIPAARLKAVPWTRFSREAADRLGR